MATIKQQLHKSKTHHVGFDPNCPQCLEDEGIDGIIDQLTRCAIQNEKDAVYGGGGRQVIVECGEARAVASEQRRMLGILKLYRLVQNIRRAREDDPCRR